VIIRTSKSTCGAIAVVPTIVAAIVICRETATSGHVPQVICCSLPLLVSYYFFGIPFRAKIEAYEGNGLILCVHRRWPFEFRDTVYMVGFSQVIANGCGLSFDVASIRRCLVGRCVWIFAPSSSKGFKYKAKVLNAIVRIEGKNVTKYLRERASEVESDAFQVKERNCESRS